MRLTAFSDMSLRILMLLAGIDAGTKLTTTEIAEGVGTPYHHVTKAVARLSLLGLVEASRGRNGGVTLTAAGRSETVGHLLRKIEEDQPMVECEASGGGECPLDHQCGLKGALRRAREAFYTELDAVVIARLPHRHQMGPVMVTLGLRPPGDQAD